MISITQAENIHSLLIEKFGGSAGVRDANAILSALARPFQRFDGHELYPSPIQKAASIIESILTNHPFVDGNKRTGYVLMRLLLISHNYDIYADMNMKYSFVIDIASSNSSFGEIVVWLEHFCKPVCSSSDPK